MKTRAEISNEQFAICLKTAMTTANIICQHVQFLKHGKTIRKPMRSERQSEGPRSTSKVYLKG